MSIRHCAVCNIILGTHSMNYCRDVENCDCWCHEDDGTFPYIGGDDEYPRFISLERALLAGAHLILSYAPRGSRR